MTNWRFDPALIKKCTNQALVNLVYYVTRPSLVFSQYISREDGGAGDGIREERGGREATIGWYLLQGHGPIGGKQSRYQFHCGQVLKPDITSPFPVRC